MRSLLKRFAVAALVVNTAVVLVCSDAKWTTALLTESYEVINNNTSSTQILPDNRLAFYSEARSDRAGANLWSMLYASATAFRYDYEYKGACITQPDQSNFASETQRLIEALGLSLPYACPTDGSAAVVALHEYKSKLNVTETWRGENLYPVEWVKGIQNIQRVQFHRPTAAVHIRRGDVTPCSEWWKRYRTNSYYEQVIQKHVPAGYDVLVFSERDSYESLNDFVALSDYNVALRLDDDLVDTFVAMTSADILITSYSAFSYAAALLNPGTVIYTKQNKAKLSSWISVDEAIRGRAGNDRRELMKACKAQ